MEHHLSQKASIALLEHVITKIIHWVMGTCLFLMLVLIFVNVVLRYGFNSGITISNEIARITFVWLIFLGSILAFRDKTHLAVNMFTKHLPMMGQKILHIIRQLVILWMLYLMFLGEWNENLVSLKAKLPVSGMSEAVFTLIILISVGSMALLCFIDIVVALFTPAKKENFNAFCTSIDVVDDLVKK